ncbi:hypothetical protein [Dyella sp. SG609]|uniref:DUF6959 family protein n=1 Tax=Dyella sp. SG609 TaxID=2587018 RepID=UPI00144628A4|nr:hypothetical protein [Dyella sp. SG609]NKJ21747.1 hypothetical protein [Dyella sp. SG609]
MKTIEVELLTDPGNNAVMRLPGRKGAGVLVQGDTLRSLLETAASVRTLAGGGSEELKAEAEALEEMLGDIYSWYELAIRDDKPFC